MTTTKPSAGALRAAEAAVSRFGFKALPHDPTLHIAKIIDSESGLAELLEACKGLLEHHWSVDASKTYRARAVAQNAIAKAEKGQP